jgi:hypothetical protein
MKQILIAEILIALFTAMLLVHVSERNSYLLRFRASSTGDADHVRSQWSYHCKSVHSFSKEHAFVNQKIIRQN